MAMGDTSQTARCKMRGNEGKAAIKIGVTERGDAGIDFSWHAKLARGGYDGAILITKNANKQFRKRVMDLYETFPNLVLHICCTGFGSTMMEPNVPAAQTQLQAIAHLLQDGFPCEKIVLRVDPIIPTQKGLARVRGVLDDFIAANTKITRVRFSVYDEYDHVRSRIIDAGARPIYNGFTPPISMIEAVVNMVLEYPDLSFETCAEDAVAMRARELGACNIELLGCISSRDLALFGLEASSNMPQNKQRRSGCHCLACKTELLSSRRRCPHQCLYCYWKDRV